jgi:hypothetical protein
MLQNLNGLREAKQPKICYPTSAGYSFAQLAPRTKQY